MTRVRHAPARRRRKKKVLKLAKGFRGGRSKLYRTAVESVHRGLYFSYRDRKARKREFRSLWIARINAACRSLGISYSKFLDGLKKCNVGLNRKMLAELAVSDRTSFRELVKMASGPRTKH